MVYMYMLQYRYKWEMDMDIQQMWILIFIFTRQYMGQFMLPRLTQVKNLASIQKMPFLVQNMRLFRMVSFFVSLVAVPPPNISIFHWKFQPADLQVENQTISCKNVELISSPFEIASTFTFGVETRHLLHVYDPYCIVIVCSNINMSRMNLRISSL